MHAIEINHVHKYFADLHALNDVDFVIPQGSFFGLLGPNGAGKSTLISIIAGLIYASQGAVTVLGNDVRQQWRTARRNLGIVPQELVFDPFFDVLEVLRLQSGYFGLDTSNNAWLNELLDILNLTDKAHTLMGQLSGGMKRRALIAQALVHRPSVVILDEPTAGVDVELRRLLWNFTKKLHADGHTIVLTTHYLEEAESLCDRIAILNQGQLAALEDTQVLLSRYPYRQLCLTLNSDALPITLPEALQEKIVNQTSNHLVLRIHKQNDAISDVLDALRTAQITFTDLHTQEPSLEEVFINLTNKEKA